MRTRRDAEPIRWRWILLTVLGGALGLIFASEGRGQAVIAGPFHGCPESGRTTIASVRALNLLKNRATEPDTINTAATLDALLAPGNDADRWRTDDGATIDGYVVDVVPGGIESVNCGATVLQFRDTHIFIGQTVTAAKRACVIVEITPRWRAAHTTADWSTAGIKKLKGQRVRVTGWLFEDAEHRQNAAHTNPHGSNVWRASTWELHPITSILVLP